MDISSIYGLGRVAPKGLSLPNRQTLPGNSDPVPTSTTANATPAKRSGAAQEFLDYMKKTPEQRMQETWLNAHGITQEQFDAMSPEEKQKILEQMRQEIEAKAKEDALRPKKPIDILA